MLRLAIFGRRREMGLGSIVDVLLRHLSLKPLPVVPQTCATSNQHKVFKFPLFLVNLLQRKKFF